MPRHSPALRPPTARPYPRHRSCLTNRRVRRRPPSIMALDPDPDSQRYRRPIKKCAEGVSHAPVDDDSPCKRRGMDNIFRTHRVVLLVSPLIKIYPRRRGRVFTRKHGRALPRRRGAVSMHARNATLDWVLITIPGLIAD